MNHTFPVTYSTLSAQTLATDILPDYGIGDAVECKFYSTGFNDTYRAKTAHGKTVYLRAYRLPWRSLADIEYELDVLNHLHRQGVPAIRPLPRKDGRFVHAVPAPEGLRYVALFTEAPGKEIAYDKNPERVAFRYGQAVARIHNAVQDFTSPHARFHIDLDHLIETPLRNIEPFLSHRADDWAYLQQFAATLRQRILDLPASALEQGFCHGDLQGYHANVGQDGILTFFDFDCCGYGYRAYDLAVFRWCARLEEQEEVRWEPYLRGYREIRPLNDLDVLAVPLFVGARYVWHMGVHTQNAPDWGCGFLNDNYFERRLDQLRAVEADYWTTEEAGA
jgi:Ser/Thr protein kinase RdoA (MazF antagonist)